MINLKHRITYQSFLVEKWWNRFEISNPSHASLEAVVAITIFYWTQLDINIIYGHANFLFLQKHSKKIPWTEEAGRLQSMGSRRVGHDWATSLSLFTFTFHFHALEKEMATHSSVLAWRIPGTGEPGGLLSLGSHRVGHDWHDLATAAAAVCWVSQGSCWQEQKAQLKWI